MRKRELKGDAIGQSEKRDKKKHVYVCRHYIKQPETIQTAFMLIPLPENKDITSLKQIVFKNKLVRIKFKRLETRMKRMFLDGCQLEASIIHNKNKI